MDRLAVPSTRVSRMNDAPVHDDRPYVLYWMTAFRRRHYNFALQRAVEHAVALGKPLVILEALRVGYQWASDRLHQFVLDGMKDNQDSFAESPVRYYAYVEPKAGEGKGLLETMAKSAAVVVADDYPCFFLPRMLAAAADELDVRLEAVDSNGLYPIRSAPKEFTRAYLFRKHLQGALPDALADMPVEDPLSGVRLPNAQLPPRGILDRWPEATATVLQGDTLASLPIDHTVAPAADRGGSVAARERLEAFLADDLATYGDGRNHPDDDRSSRLSAWLHFGHLSSHEVLARIASTHDWTPAKMRHAGPNAPRPDGQKGTYNLNDGCEAFLDEIVTWRELGFVTCALRDDFDELDSLPPWARATLQKHEKDRREHLYDLGEFERAKTHDEIWNAAQRQLVQEGRIHNYLRMLWGKKILEWTKTPADALAVMIELNNKYALDGRDPNSYSGIFWVLGRYDRAWGPERPVYGTIRYMSSDSTRRKIRLKRYLERFGEQAQGALWS